MCGVRIKRGFFFELIGAYGGDARSPENGTVSGVCRCITYRMYRNPGVGIETGSTFEWYCSAIVGEENESELSMRT